MAKAISMTIQVQGAEETAMDILDLVAGVVRDKIAELASERFRWPAPNPEGELWDAWKAHKAAYARHVFGGEPEPSPTGIPETTGDQLAQAWDGCVTR